MPLAVKRWCPARFVQRNRVHLCVAIGMFALGLGIALYLFVVLGRWQGRNTLTCRSLSGSTWFWVTDLRSCIEGISFNHRA